MGARKGEIHRCTQPGCELEVQVTKGCVDDSTGNEPLRCCCGSEMKKT